MHLLANVAKLSWRILALRTLRNVKKSIFEKSKMADDRHFEQDGLAVASIARDVVVEMTPPRDHNAR